MMKRLLASITLATLADPAAILAVDRFDPPSAIVNARIHVGDGTVIERGVIVMREGRIVAIGAEAVIPADAERIDVDGAIVYPGFIDAHSFVGIRDRLRGADERRRTEDETPDRRQEPPAETDAAARRGVRAHLRAEELFAPTDDELERFRKAGFATALVAPRSGIFAGTSAWTELSGLPLRRAVMRADAAQHSAFVVGEPGDDEYPESLLGIIAQFRQTLLDASWNVQRQQYFQSHSTAAERAARDEVLDALQPLLAGTTPLVFEANGENEILRARDLAGEFKLKPIISGAKEAWRLVDRLKADRIGLIVSLKFDEEPEYGKDKAAEERRRQRRQREKAATRPAGELEELEKEDEPPPTEDRIYEPLKLRQERRRLWEEQVANVIRLHEAGIPFALSTREFEKPAELLENLRKVISRGLPEPAAVAALSRTPAEMFGLADQLGTLAVGRLANLTILDKPLSDEQAGTRFVFIEGKKFEIDREKRKDAKKPRRGDDAATKPALATSPAPATSTAPTPTTATAPATQPDDEGPTWRCEIEADRMPKTQTGGNVLVRNATVMTVTRGVIQNASILIRNGKITQVGSAVAAPPGVKVIDASGRFVTPGLIDCHSHMAIDGVNEGTLAVTAEVRVGDLVRNRDVSIYRALAGGITTTHAMHGSANPIGGQNVTFKLKRNRPAKEMILPNLPRTIKFALGENVIQSNWANAWGKRFPNTRMGVESTIRQAFLLARQYAREWAEYRAASAAGKDVPPPRRDLRLEALAEMLAGDITVHCHCYRADEILRLLEIAEDFGIRIGVLQHALEGYRVAPEIARHGCGLSSFANEWAYKIEAFDSVPYNAAMVTRHGVCATVNSDSANTIRFMNAQAAKSMRWGGLDETEALRLVTLNAAIQLLIDDRVGSIDVGKDGDLAIWNGHPLDIYSQCVMTLIEGEVYFEHPSPAPELRTSSVQPAADTTADGIVPLPATPPSQSGAYAIVRATVHPVSGPAIENATVVMTNGRIEAVGANVAPPGGAGVIDGRGLHVYPGLIDAGGTLGLAEVGSLRATQDSSDIARFQPDLRAASAFNPHSVHVPILRAAGFTLALARPGGGAICGQSALMRTDGWTAREMVVADRVMMHMRLPSLPIHIPEKDRIKRTEEHARQIHEIEDYIARARLYAAAVEQASSDATKPPPLDPDLDALVPYVTGSPPKRICFFASDYKHLLDTIEFADKHQLRIAIMGGAEAWKLADVLARKQIPVLIDSVTSYPATDFEAFDSVYAGPGVLDQASVAFAFASGGAAEAYNLSFEAGLAVAYGLDADRALHALTLGAAKILGVDDRYGSIEPGKTADLIVTTGSPMQPSARVLYVFIDGRPVDLHDKHRRDYEKFSQRPAPNLPPARADLKGPQSMTAP